MLLVVILGAIALVAMRIAGVGNLAKKKPPTPNVAAISVRHYTLLLHGDGSSDIKLICCFRAVLEYNDCPWQSNELNGCPRLQCRAGDGQSPSDAT